MSSLFQIYQYGYAPRKSAKAKGKRVALTDVPAVFIHRRKRMREAANVGTAIYIRPSARKYMAATIMSFISPAFIQPNAKKGKNTANIKAADVREGIISGTAWVMMRCSASPHAEAIRMKFLILELTISVRAQIKSVNRNKYSFIFCHLSL